MVVLLFPGELGSRHGLGDEIEPLLQIVQIRHHDRDVAAKHLGVDVRTAAAVIAVGGEFGTLSEIAFALKLGRPVVGLGTWELGKAGRPTDAIIKAQEPREAVRLALEAIANPSL